MPNETIVIRLPASQIDRLGTCEVRQMLERGGIDTAKPMSCRVDGVDLVYEGSPVTKGHVVTKDNLGVSR